MNPIVRIQNISKEYSIGARQVVPASLRETLAGAFRAPLRRLRRNGLASKETFWALKDINFEVQPGEVLGIIGKNGAGKSTLLKVLSRITEPTTGRVELYGRLGSLLEVGTGFHPELTGRENIYLNGSILGISRREIDRKFDEIVAFSEVERFLDTAVKYYSSGMYVRLAFAVAAHLEPEILLVDEVLAVGDAGFQAKCLGKMGDVARSGRTVIFISHNMQAITTLCHRAALLDEGRLVQLEETAKVIDGYLKRVGMASVTPLDQVWETFERSPGNGRVRLRAVRIVPEAEAGSVGIDMQTSFCLEVEYWNLVPETKVIVNFAVYAIDGSPAFETFTFDEPYWQGQVFCKGIYRSVCRIPAHLMNQGTYRLRIAFLDEFAEVLYDNVEASIFSVHDVGKRRFPWYSRFIGNVHPKFEWTTELLERVADKPVAESPSRTAL
jgi:lipopolysaccharide transport system ATP-binding protein